MPAPTREALFHMTLAELTREGWYLDLRCAAPCELRQIPFVLLSRQRAAMKLRTTTKLRELVARLRCPRCGERVSETGRAAVLSDLRPVQYGGVPDQWEVVLTSPDLGLRLPTSVVV